MFFGLNEDSGLPCVYHGWKFDVDGRAVDLPNVPVDSKLHRTVRTKSYPCREAGEFHLGLHGASGRRLAGWSLARVAVVGVRLCPG